jgi:transcriptional regulator GlxA family with amidase domain
MEYRLFTRISRAKELLSSSKMSIESIAAECGFSSANYFSLIFKKEVGISPRSYRKMR